MHAAAVALVEAWKTAQNKGARAEGASGYQMVELFEENGHVYIDYLGTFHYAWNGCPC